MRFSSRTRLLLDPLSMQLLPQIEEGLQGSTVNQLRKVLNEISQQNEIEEQKEIGEQTCGPVYSYVRGSSIRSYALRARAPISPPKPSVEKLMRKQSDSVILTLLVEVLLLQ